MGGKGSANAAGWSSKRVNNVWVSRCLTENRGLHCGSPLSGQVVVFQTGKWNHRALLPLGLPKLTSYCPCSQVQEHIICKPRADAVELLFPSVADPQEGSLGQDPQKSQVTITVRGKQIPPPSHSAVLPHSTHTGEI